MADQPKPKTPRKRRRRAGAPEPIIPPGNGLPLEEALKRALKTPPPRADRNPRPKK